MCVPKVSLLEGRGSEIRPFEMRRPEVGSFEMRRPEVGSPQDRTAKIETPTVGAFAFPGSAHRVA